MGITIHYQGRARDDGAVGRVLDAAEAFARERGWVCQRCDVEDGVVERYDMELEEFVAHRGRVRGIVIVPHKECEPVMIEFTPDRRIQHFTKTQYAPFGVHVAIVELIRRVAPEFAELEVHDEAGLWETGDMEGAERKFVELYGYIKAMREKLEADGPVNDALEPFG